MKGLFCSECQYGATLSPSSNTKWWPQSGERQISANSCRQITRFKNISQTTRGRTIVRAGLGKSRRATRAAPVGGPPTRGPLLHIRCLLRTERMPFGKADMSRLKFDVHHRVNFFDHEL